MKQFILASLILSLASTGLTSITPSSSAVTSPTSQDPAAPKQPATRRTELQRHDLSIGGREALQLRVDFPAGASFGKHTHPGEEIIYVIEGLLEYTVEGKPPVILKAGQVLFIPAGTVHAAKNVGKGNGAELATYIVEKGKPLIMLVK